MSTVKTLGFKVGEKLVYPNHGVTVVEQIGESAIIGPGDTYYHLRLLANNSRLMVPIRNTDRVGLRPLYKQTQIKGLIGLLEERSQKAHTDWKGRYRENMEKMKTGRLEDVAFLKYDVTNLAYSLPNRARTAVIGVGGGRDILAAAAFGHRDITGVELNPVFVKLLAHQRGFADFTNFAKLGGVRLVVDEGRSWFARTTSRFDLIQMSLIDTWAATGAGAYSLSENGLYTLEGWRRFVAGLSRL